MPEGIEDNYVDEMFLKGLVHKSIFKNIIEFRQFPRSALPSYDKRNSRNNSRNKHSSTIFGKKSLDSHSTG